MSGKAFRRSIVIRLCVFMDVCATPNFFGTNYLKYPLRLAGHNFIVFYDSMNKLIVTPIKTLITNYICVTDDYPTPETIQLCEDRVKSIFAKCASLFYEFAQYLQRTRNEQSLKELKFCRSLFFVRYEQLYSFKHTGLLE